MEDLGCILLRQPFAFVALVAVMLILTSFSISVSSHTYSLDATTLDMPSREKEFELQSTQVLFQIPENPKAVLFIAPDCSKKASDFWNDFPHCSECKCLPEEQALLSKAISRGYAVITISGEGRGLSHEAYLGEVGSFLTGWISSKGLDGLPVAALGVDTGGYFAFDLVFKFPFQALILMLSEGNPKSLAPSETFTPTLFVHMPKDRERSLAIRKTIDLLESKGVDTDEIECKELPLYPRFFSERISCLDEETSGKIYAILRDSGWLDEKSYLKRDPLSMNWQMAVKKRQVLPSGEPGKVKWEDHIQEELNLAYGYHEISSMPSDTIFNWLESKIFNLIKTV